MPPTIDNALAANRSDLDPCDEFADWDELRNTYPDRFEALEREALADIASYIGPVGIAPVYFDGVLHADSGSDRAIVRGVRSCVRDWVIGNGRRIAKALESSYV